MTTSVQFVDPQTAHQWLNQGEAVLVDVREPNEYASRHIPGATLVPLTGFDLEKVPSRGEKKLIVHCKAGIRSKKAADVLVRAGGVDVYSMVGGIDAWAAAGLATAGSGKPVMDVQRQVFIVVSAMILIGLGLGVWINAWWLLGPFFAGLGLLNAGLTGGCPLRRMIAAMPWNQRTGGGRDACPT